MNRAVQEALRDAEDAYADKGILVVHALEATREAAPAGPALHQAIYTLFRGLPGRLAEGAILYVSTRDLAQGDVELSWEAREADAPSPAADPNPDEPRHVLRAGPQGDLLELAILGLTALCRAEGDLSEYPEHPRRATSTALDLSPKVRRRFTFVIPGAREIRAGEGDVTRPGEADER